MNARPPSRRDLIRELDERGLKAREIAELLGCTVQNINYHLKSIRAEQAEAARTPA